MSLYYHCTSPKHVDSILEKGLLKGVEGVVYMSDTEDNAFDFMGFRATIEFVKNEFDIIDKDGKEIKVPKTIRRRFVPVFVINTNKLTQRKFSEGTDHNPMFFKGKSIVYNGNISKNHIIGIYIYDIEKYEKRRYTINQFKQLPKLEEWKELL